MCETVGCVTNAQNGHRGYFAACLWISLTWKAVLDKNAWDEDYNTRHPPDNFMDVKAKAKPQRCDEVANTCRTFLEAVEPESFESVTKGAG